MARLGSYLCAYFLLTGTGVLAQLEWLDPTMIVTTLSTSLTLIKYITAMWQSLTNERQDGGGILNIPGPIADLDFETCFLGNNCTANGNASDLIALTVAHLNSDRAVLARFSAISAKLATIDTRLMVVEGSLARFVRQLPSLIQWELGIDRLMATMRPIQSLYDTFRSYQDQQDQIERATLEDFATTLVSHGTDSVRGLLWELHDLAVPAEEAYRRIQSIEPSPHSRRRQRRQHRRELRRHTRQLQEGIFNRFRDYFKVRHLHE